LVVAGTGGGTVNLALEAALLRAQSSGVRVVRASRSCAGGVRTQPDQRLPLAEGLTPAKARIALMLDLMSA
jgi:L-asparaginase